MKPKLLIAVFVLAAAVAGCTTHEQMGNMGEKLDMSQFYLPNAEASKIVSVTSTTNGPIGATIYVQTHAVAVKENWTEGNGREVRRNLRFFPELFRGAQRRADADSLFEPAAG